MGDELRARDRAEQVGGRDQGARQDEADVVRAGPGARGAKLEADYIIVHAVRRPGQPDTTIRLLTRKRGTFLVYREAGELVVWVRQSGGYATPARCDMDGGFIHPSYDDSTPSTKSPVGDPVDPYELDGPQPKYNCQASTGT
ncbi:hypothetical protein GCM10020220_070270 [Nonomuraea rubra]|uniref:hypothetical protein n=1 Tax=Nonomuraea rubra TaxID=46180 RepID=UPI0031E66053